MQQIIIIIFFQVTDDGNAAAYSFTADTPAVAA